MRLRRDLKPFQRSVPTKASLDLVRQLAELTGLPFDEEAVSDEAHSLYELMFDDLTSTLGIDPESVRFQSGYYFAPRAFAARHPSGRPQISLDTTFDYWISALSHFGVMAMCEPLTEGAIRDLAGQVHQTCLLFEDASLFEPVREAHLPYLARYPHLLNLSQGLARAMLVFTLCHELAHCRLDHLSTPDSPDQELAADRQAAELFLRIVRHGENNPGTTIHVDPKIACAPMALMHLIGLHEAWLNRQGSRDKGGGKHPPASKRLDAVTSVLEPHLNETAVYVLTGFVAGLEDIRSVLLDQGIS